MYYLPRESFCVNSNILPRAGLWRVGEGGGRSDRICFMGLKTCPVLLMTVTGKEKD
jgi:hypothetical protein